MTILAARFAALAAAIISLGACGDLDNFTTVKDLRVLAVKSEPPGFLVPLDAPETIPATEATLTALVVDPKGNGATLTFSGAACPNYLDAVTAATGKASSLCPGPEVTGQFPPPLNQALATTMLPPGVAMPVDQAMIAYEPTMKFGLTPAQLGLFFSPAPNLPAAVAPTVQFNRDYGMDAIVNVDFALGSQAASMLKRVVYWPLLPDALLPTGAEAAKPDCPATQVANTNPKLTAIDLFRHRVEGEPVDPYPDMSTLSLAAKDELFVQPAYDPASIEKYLLRVKNFETGTVDTQCRHETLTFQFFATSGTFSPAERQSELPPFLAPPDDGKVHIDSQWNPPAAKDLPADGRVTLWVVVRDERAGATWDSKTFFITP
jgi:hypothetical protein